ncbi:hypothetical protein KKA08_08510, partial [bacterium]|nr:hypothetical protein [bacterium]
PAANYCGVCTDSDYVTDALIDKAKEIAKDLDLDYLELKDFKDNNFNLIKDLSHITFLIPLDSNPEIVQSHLEKSVKKNIKKAKASGLTIHWDKCEVRDFYKIYIHNMKTGLLLISLLAIIFVMGCGATKEPNSPETGVPIYDVILDPEIIVPLAENTRIALAANLTLDFESFDGLLVWFRDDPDSGAFGDVPARYIDLDTSDNLNMPIWYQYLGFGSQDTLEVKIYAHVVSMAGDTLAWNYAVLKVVGSQ